MFEADADDPEAPPAEGESRAAKAERSRKKWVKGLNLVLPIDMGFAQHKGPIKKLVELLESKEVDANEEDIMKLRPLHKAAARGYTEAIAVLLDHGAEIDAADVNGLTALAKCGDRPECAEARALLLARGATDTAQPRKKLFRYRPKPDRSYWIFAQDENGNSNDNNPDAPECEPPAYAVKTAPPA
mmetsp:Transcript_73549/g.202021  ORF Transcript_73549/g.202021 Transcript_73549/m.202021 type:complete len:186 (-) Transcript_73549:296-853(-)|eukprot:4556809-Prymnesium_polylepis.1